MAEFKFYTMKDNKPKNIKVQLSNNELDKLKVAREKLLAVLKLEDLYDQIITPTMKSEVNSIVSYLTP